MMPALGKAGMLAALVAGAIPATVMADPVDDYVQAEMTRHHVPGLALAIMRHGQLVRAQGYGYANIEHSVPVHPDTLFKSGAIGMQFTAVAAMLLVEDGKLGLDTSIRAYLPQAPRSWAPITIRNLLNHTSGLPATPNGEFRTDYTDDQLLAIIYKQDLNFPAGARWRFSYSDYIVLGFIIRRVSGDFYADLLRKRVFDPLGMRTARAIDERAIIPNRAAGYELSGTTLRNADWVSPTANSTADGSLYLSVLDYARWEAGIVGQRLLKPESWALIRQPATLPDARTYPYGFGWFLGTNAGREMWWHSGSWQGFKTFVVRYLGDDLTVAIFENDDGGDPDAMARHIAGLVVPELAAGPATPVAGANPGDTDRIRALLLNIAAGRAPYADFAFVSKQDFTDMMADYRAQLSPLGPPREIALFGQSEIGTDQVRRFRARYDDAVVEIRIGYTPTGKIGSLDVSPVEAWTAPAVN
ncbi:beta-lactamase family protein [Sphingomonas sp. CL5.1]|uniref:serine hydrolase domain-containing protein n=1 Tax=Sphingomonas sp. CL5.1 TaxID=2653203 RepID=UPI0015839489|nr:serine hydrolase domain-containing protein [Sphingomonas sp. CL5.1]QKS01163.1 beta-lactamase family protein [Sphingomonas sp. CL5.1]